MIYWAPFLHFYQPPIQFHAILKKVCDESYRPLIDTLLQNSGAKVTINICGVLTELLNDHGARDVIEGIKKLADNKQLEFVESAKYHPILPLIPEKEMQRQIKLNYQANNYFFTSLYKPKGFFPPEMCYSSKMAQVIADMGYSWILISGIACQDKWPLDFISEISYESQAIKILYRDDILSNKISFRNIDSAGFIKQLVEFPKNEKDIYVITAMDAETFGHHIQNWEKLFLADVYKTINALDYSYHHDKITQRNDLSNMHKKIFSELKESSHIKVVTISELINKFPVKKTAYPAFSSWSSTKDDITKNNFYPLWKSAGNHIHELQWEHLNICFELIDKALSLKGDNKQESHFAMIARGLLDRAVHSCQFWWANKERGTWDMNLINKGLIDQEEALLNAYKAIGISSVEKEIKKDFYHKLVAARDIASKIRDLILSINE